MAQIKPFKAIRPNPEALILRTSHSLNNLKLNDGKVKKLNRNPYPFLQILHPGMGEQSLVKIRPYYRKLMTKKILIEEPQESFYLYRQVKNENHYLGIIGCGSIDDYFAGVIRTHEQTLTRREEAWVHYLEICDFNCEPICVCYPDEHEISEVTEKMIEEEPLYDFITIDDARHTFWAISETEDIVLITEIFRNIPSLYIADGHHRMASSAFLGLQKRESDPDYTGKENYNSFMCVLYPESQLKIYNYNRLIKDLNLLRFDEFLNKIKTRFYIEVIGKNYQGPIDIHEFGMYLRGLWYKLILKKHFLCTENPVSCLDAVILSEFLLAPILGIHDLRNDPRISFQPGIQGIQALEQTVDSGEMQIAFVLFPATMEQVKLVADTDKLVPPKTTWVEPKQINGLIIYTLS